MLDQQEQMLISFFGLDQISNRQSGGVAAVFNPGQEDFDIYRSLPTKQTFFKLLLPIALQPPSSKR